MKNSKFNLTCWFHSYFSTSPYDGPIRPRLAAYTNLRTSLSYPICIILNNVPLQFCFLGILARQICLKRWMQNRFLHQQTTLLVVMYLFFFWLFCVIIVYEKPQLLRESSPLNFIILQLNWLEWWLPYTWTCVLRLMLFWTWIWLWVSIS